MKPQRSCPLHSLFVSSWKLQIFSSPSDTVVYNNELSQQPRLSKFFAMFSGNFEH